MIEKDAVENELKTANIDHAPVDESISLCDQIENALKGHNIEAVIESVSLIHQEVWYTIQNAPIGLDEKQYYFDTFRYHIDAMQDRLKQPVKE